MILLLCNTTPLELSISITYYSNLVNVLFLFLENISLYSIYSNDDDDYYYYFMLLLFLLERIYSFVLMIVVLY